jgi:hypothetical protein
MGVRCGDAGDNIGDPELPASAGAGHSGGRFQPGGRTHPSGGAGQLGGGLNRKLTPQLFGVKEVEQLFA